MEVTKVDSVSGPSNAWLPALCDLLNRPVSANFLISFSINVSIELFETLHVRFGSFPAALRL